MEWFNNITIRNKLYGLVAFSTLGLAAVLLLSGWLLMQFRVNGPVYGRIILAKDIVADILPPPEYIIEPFLVLHQIDHATDKSEIQLLSSRFDKLREEYHKRHVYWTKNLPEGEIRDELLVHSFQPAEEFFQVAGAEYLPLKNKGEHDTARQVLLNRLRPLYEKHRKAIDRTVELANQQAEREEKLATERIGFWMTAIVVIGLATVLLVGTIGVLLARNIVRATRLLIDRVNEMASGASDLTARIQVRSRDEIGQLATGINAMIGKIHSVVQRVRESSIQLLSTASEMAATAQQQETTMQNLGSSTTEIAAAVQEISATSKQLATAMNDVNERSSQAASLATTGRSRLTAMHETMQQLVDSTASISSKLALIREKAENINMVVTTITKVADQTNLLSINAAIEAEKAGEYGRGFLVVAREIRRLADQTAVATLDIENMVRHMHDAVSSGVMQMDKFSEEVRSGVNRVAEINGQTGQIIEEVQGLSDRFHTVNESMRQQSVGAQQINDAMLNVSNSTRQTAASLEEFNKATAHLRKSVESLNQEIAQFTI